MTIDELKKIMQKASKKKNGVYSSNGVYYSVHNGCLYQFGHKMFGDINEFVGIGIVKLGNIDIYKLRKELNSRLNVRLTRGILKDYL